MRGERLASPLTLGVGSVGTGAAAAAALPPGPAAAALPGLVRLLGLELGSAADDEDDDALEAAACGFCAATVGAAGGGIGVGLGFGLAAAIMPEDFLGFCRDWKSIWGKEKATG